jgi:hypothetical protein
LVRQAENVLKPIRAPKPVDTEETEVQWFN